MNKKLIGLAIIPIIGLIFIASTPDPETNSFEVEDKQEAPAQTASEPPKINSSEYSLEMCSGSAKCFVGTVTKIVDGHSIHVDDHYVRFALSSAPYVKTPAGMDAKGIIETLCPVGSQALVDEDDGQTPEGHSRVIGVVYCNDVILNKELLDSTLGYLSDRFCDSSEFGSSTWAQRHGCSE